MCNNVSYHLSQDSVNETSTFHHVSLLLAPIIMVFTLVINLKFAQVVKVTVSQAPNFFESFQCLFLHRAERIKSAKFKNLNFARLFV